MYGAGSVGGAVGDDVGDNVTQSKSKTCNVFESVIVSQSKPEKLTDSKESRRVFQNAFRPDSFRLGGRMSSDRLASFMKALLPM